MEKLNSHTKEKWTRFTIGEYFLFLGFILSITFIKFAPISIVLGCLLAFDSSKIKQGFRSLFQYNSPVFWLIVFYLLHVLGLLYTTNYNFAFSDLGMKASFLLFPILFSFTRFEFNLKSLFQFLNVSLALAALSILSFAFGRMMYYEGHFKISYILENEISLFYHRGYWSTYLSIFSAISLYFAIEYKKYRWINSGAFLILTLVSLLTLSKAGALLLIILISVVFLQFILKKLSLKFKLLSIGSLLLIFSLLLFSNNPLSSRFNEIYKAFSTFKTENNTTIESNASRLIMWSTSTKLIKENFLLGVGTGDVKDALKAKNLELGNTGVVEKNLNAHNQFLNTWVQIGVIGFLALCLIIFFQFKAKSNFEMKLFAFGFAFSMLFESFVESQAGIIPFALLTSLYLLSANRTAKSQSS
jgi:O-antigen ligase